MYLSYGNIIFIAITLIIIIFITYLIISKKYSQWDEFKINKLENFIQNNSILIDDYNILTDDKKKCFYDNFTKNISYSTFSNILDIRINSNSYNNQQKIIYLNNNNDYQTFILNILKYISFCLNVSIDDVVVEKRLNDKITGTPDEIKQACQYIATQLNDNGYTLNQLNYLDKFYVDPVTNKSNAQVIKNFVDFLTKINKWAPKN